MFGGVVPGPFLRWYSWNARPYCTSRNSSSSSFSRVALCLALGIATVIHRAPIPITTIRTAITNPDASDCCERMNVLSSVSQRMIKHIRPLAPVFGLFLTLGVAACDKVPLLAPTGTVINLTATSEIAALNSSVDLIAVLIENGTSSGTGTGTASTSSSSSAAGTPVQNGTVVSFTSTIGRIEPAEAKTSNGRVTVKLVTTGESGKATITAFSGGAKSTIQVTIGSAAVKTITVSASPSNLSSNGGTTTVSARVEDSNGNGLVGVPVTFTSTRGTLGAGSANTNSVGIATTTLTTTAAADVTASVGAVNSKVTIGVAARATISVTGPSSTVSVSSPATFTVNTGSTVPVTNVTINYGDGTSKALGALSGSQSVTHFYASTGIFDVTIAATDADSVVTTAGTQVAIVGIGLGLQSSAATVARGTAILFTAAVTPNTVAIDHFEWDFGDGTNKETTTSTTQNHVFDPAITAGIKTVSVRVVPLYGASYVTSIQIPVT